MWRSSSYVVVLLFALLFSLAGCSSFNRGTQALAPGAENMDSVKNNLVYMPVHISPVQANLKLSAMELVDRANSERIVFKFGDDMILRTKQVPYEIEGTAFVQKVLIDLPPGEYELVDVSFAFNVNTTSAGVMHELVEPKLAFQVAESTATYVGRLNIEFEKVLIKGLLGTQEITFPMPSSVTAYTSASVLRGELAFTVEDQMSEDVAKAISRYPGLQSATFSTNLLR